MNIDPDDFKDWTLRNVLLKYEGWLELQRARERESWERARMIAYFAASGNLKKGTKPSDLFRNPYEIKRKGNGRNFTQAELDARLKRLDELEYKEIKR